MKRFNVFVLVLVLAVSSLPILAVASESMEVSEKQTTDTAASLPGLSHDDFQQLVERGFGERTNAYAWSMGELNGDLYIGTGRYQTTLNPMWETIWAALTPTARPPQLPDVPDVPYLRDFLMRTSTAVIVTDPAKFQAWNTGSQAEIWRLRSGVWSKVFDTPFVPSYLRAMDGTMPYQAAASLGLRSMSSYTDAQGRTSLLAFTGGLTLARPDQTILIYGTQDGTSWAPLLTSPQMGLQTRATGVHNGKLYVGVDVGPAVWSTDTVTPTPGSWHKVFDLSQTDTTNSAIISLCSFNDRLYVGTQNVTGFQVWASTVPDPTNTADFVKIITDGAGDQYNAWAGTMKVFRGDLYVGSMSLPFLSGYSAFKGFDLIRIHPDNRWELVVGDRNPVSPPAGASPRNPISGWSSGFGNILNLYCWSLEEYDGVLYLGTFDASIFLRYLKEYSGPLPSPFDKLTPEVIDLLLGGAGADLWKSWDGVSWVPVTLTGFSDMNNYGLRTMLASPRGLFIGTSNPFWGCQVWAAEPIIQHFPLNVNPGWNLISLPIVTATQPEMVFAGLPGSWSLYRWDPVSNRYQTRDQITLTVGDAYWLKVQGLTQPCQLDIVGMRYPCSYLRKPLTVGWNAVGCPYQAAVPWGLMKIQIAESMMTLDDAIAAGVIGSRAWFYDGICYRDVKIESGGFVPGVGVWVQAKQPCSLVFTRP